MTTPLEQMQHKTIAQILEQLENADREAEESKRLAAAYKRRIEEYEDAVRRAKTKPMSYEVYSILMHY